VSEVQKIAVTITVGNEYYLRKGETIASNAQQYSAHIKVVQNCIGRHSVKTMGKALVDRIANGGICVADMFGV
jgi:hypothetical protein